MLAWYVPSIYFSNPSFRTVNSFVTMGWPLFFTPKEFECSQEYRLSDGSCDFEKICNSEAILKEKFNQKSNTIIYEFSLYCDRYSWVAFCKSTFFMSMIVSDIFFSILSDVKGRKPALLLSMVLSSLSLLLIPLSPNIAIWTVLIAIAGFGTAGLEIISLVYVSEISAKRFRNHAMVALTAMWAVS